MATEKEMVAEEVVTEEETVIDTDKELGEIVKEDGKYYMLDFIADTKVEAPITPDGRYLHLPKNSAGREYVTINGLEKKLEKGERYVLFHKEHRTLNTSGTIRMPGQNVLKYLTEEEQEELKKIMTSATERRAAERKKPMTEKEKLEKKIQKAREALEKLLASAGNTEVVEDIIEEEM